MSRHPTSGKLETADLSEVLDTPGLLEVTAPWWIDTGVTGWSFELQDATGKVVVRLESSGRLHLLPGFIYNGSSGPTADRPELDNVAAGLHDAVYRALRARKLPAEARKPADEFYAKLLEERGMSPWWHPVKPRPWWKVWHVLNPGYRTRYYGLRAFGGIKAAVPVKGPEYKKRLAA